MTPHPPAAPVTSAVAPGATAPRAVLASTVLLCLLGLASVAATVNLPWREEEFVLGPGIRWAMAATGVVVLVRATAIRRTPGPRLAVQALGVSTVAYPSLLGLAAAGVGGSASAAIGVLGDAGHVLPLTLLQLTPVLVSGQVTGRRRRGWAWAIVAVAVSGVVTTTTGLALGSAGTPLLALSLVLWFGSFVLAPVACWTALRHAVGEPRRRGILAALAALVPLLLILWCSVLVALAPALRLPATTATDALFVGFCLAVGSCGLLCVAALGSMHGPLLRRPVMVFLVRALVVGIVALVASGAALASAALLPTREAAVLVAVPLTVALGWLALRLFGWAAEVVDPAAELRLELARAASLAPGQQSRAAEAVVRRLLADESARLAFAIDADTWVDVGGTVVDDHESQERVVLAGGASPAVALLATEPRTRRQAATWGDCAAALRPALLEAREAWHAARASGAAAAERARLQQDLHDGVQGRLLGLALHLQMSASGIEDDGARRAVTDAVGGLRDAVQDVRALARGTVPQVLVDEGLGAAVRSLLQPVRSHVGELELSPRLVEHRPPAPVEACAFFVVSEAVANAVKHAAAGRIDVAVGLGDSGDLVVTVRDDGRGGADPRRGTGLRGIAERVEAHGGLLLVSDADGAEGAAEAGCTRPADGRGTLVQAVLPCAP